MQLNWYYPFGAFEYVAAGLFIILYLLYGWRIGRIARQLHTRRGALWGKFILRSAYFGLMLTALLGPSLGETQREIKTSGRDIYVLVDISASMEATDIVPSRLERAKFELLRLIDDWPSNRIGLIVFSKQAFVQCPLTADRQVLSFFIKALTALPNGGTHLGAALSLALQKFALTSSPRQRSEVVVLVSDGEDFGEATAQVARQFKLQGIPLFVLGVGSDQGSTLVTNNRPRNDQQGQPILSRLNRRGLQQLALLGGGRYFELGNTLSEAPALGEAVNRIEGRLQDVRLIDVSANKYYYFLLLGLILMALDILITSRVFVFS